MDTMIRVKLLFATMNANASPLKRICTKSLINIASNKTLLKQVMKGVSMK
jgi:hypothetical protein